ncbi:MAG: VirD4-like conjugal transfer protein, CD1115 family [Bacillota bacterium]
MPPAVLKLKTLLFNPRLRILLSSRRAKIALVTLAAYVLDAWLLGSFCVFFKDSGMAGRMFASPLYAAAVLPFQGVLPWWLLLNLVVGASGFAVFLKLSASFPGMFKIKKKEPEFTEDPSCGTARWLSPREAEKVFRFGHGPGVLLGLYGGKPARLNDDIFNRFVVVFGPPKFGKTTRLVVPNLLQAAFSGESCIVTDPKGEIEKLTRRFFESRGYEVRVFELDPDEMARSDRWNPLADIKDDLDAQLFSEVVIANTTVAGIRKIGGDLFWTSAEQNLLKALTLYVVNEYPPENRNMESLYALLSCGSLDQLDLTFASLSAGHPARAAWNIFAQADKRVRSDVIQGLGVRIQVFQNEGVKRLTSASDIDLEAPGLKKCICYCGISDKQPAFRFLANLFFSFLFIKLMQLADRNHGPCPVPVNFILDEFCNIGQIPDFKNKIATMRSRGLSCILIVQDLPQLRGTYRDTEWEEILACCDTQMVFGSNDSDTEEYFSRRLGVGTVEKVSLRKKAMALERVHVTRAPSARRLMTPDEIGRLPRNLAVVKLGGYPPALIEKLPYTEHPLGAALDQACREVKVVFPEEPPGETRRLPEETGQPPAEVHGELQQLSNREAAASEPPAQEGAPQDKFW